MFSSPGVVDPAPLGLPQFHEELPGRVEPEDVMPFVAPAAAPRPWPGRLSLPSVTQMFVVAIDEQAMREDDDTGTEALDQAAVVIEAESDRVPTSFRSPDRNSCSRHTGGESTLSRRRDRCRH